MAIDINDYSIREMNVDGKVHSAIYLESGLLILGGDKITVLRTGKSSFELVLLSKSENCLYDA